MDFLQRATAFCVTTCALGLLATSGCGRSSAPRKTAEDAPTAVAEVQAMDPIVAGSDGDSIVRRLRGPAIEPIGYTGRISRLPRLNSAADAAAKPSETTQPPDRMTTAHVAEALGTTVRRLPKPPPTLAASGTDSLATRAPGRTGDSLPDAYPRLTFAPPRGEDSPHEVLPYAADRSLPTGPTKWQTPAPVDPEFVRDRPAPTAAALQAVTQQADELIARGFAMAQRGATFSAAKNFRQALLVIARALDAHAAVEEHSAALGRGWRALREAEQFGTTGTTRDAELSVASIVAGQRTPVLHGVALTGMTPVTAAQRYYTYAQEQFARASHGVPAGSVALYGLGKLEAASAQGATKNGQLHVAQAMVLHQAALLVDANNGYAANELGVMLARAGAWPAARQVLAHGVASVPQPTAWRNLAIVHERLGETELAQLAFREWQVAQQHAGNPLARSQLGVEWVLPEEMDSRPRPPHAGEGRTAQRPTPGRPAVAPSSPASGSWWQIWK